MNYEDLINLLVESFKTGVPKNITADKLREALIKVVEFANVTRGDYQGTATPTTNPGTPSTPVYYFARQSGTYTNFGGIEVDATEGINILSYSGSAWSKAVVPIDLSGYATDTVLKNVRSEDISDWYGGEFNISGYVRKDNGKLNAGPYKCTDFIDIDPSKPIKLRGKDGTTASILNFYDLNKNFISPYSTSTISPNEVELTIQPSEIPSNAVFIRASADEHSTTCFLKPLRLNIKDISEKFGELIGITQGLATNKTGFSDVFFTSDKKTNNVVSEIYLHETSPVDTYRVGIIRNGGMISGNPAWTLEIKNSSGTTVAIFNSNTKPDPGIVVLNPVAGSGVSGYANINFNRLAEAEVYSSNTLLDEKSRDLTKSPTVLDFIKSENVFHAVGLSVDKLSKELYFQKSDFRQGYLSGGNLILSDTVVTTKEFIKVVPDSIIRFASSNLSLGEFYKIRVSEYDQNKKYVKQSPSSSFSELNTLRVENPFVKISLQLNNSSGVISLPVDSFINYSFKLNRDITFWNRAHFDKIEFDDNIKTIFPDLDYLDHEIVFTSSEFIQGSITRGVFNPSVNVITSKPLKVVPGSTIAFTYLPRVDRSYFNVRINEFDLDDKYLTSYPETSWAKELSSHVVSGSLIRISILRKDEFGVNSPLAPEDLVTGEFTAVRSSTVFGGDFLTRLSRLKSTLETEIGKVKEEVSGASVGKLRTAIGHTGQIGQAKNDYIAFKLIEGQPSYIETSGSRGLRNYRGNKFLALQYADFFIDDANVNIPLLNKYGFSASFVVQQCPKDNNFMDGFAGRAGDDVKLMQLIFSSGSNLEDHTPWHWTLSHELPFADGRTFPSNNELRLAVNGNRNVFGYDVSSPVSDKIVPGYLLGGINYEGKNWEDLTNGDCDNIRKTLAWFSIPRIEVSGSVVETGGTRVLECLDFLSNRYLGTTGYGRIPVGGLSNPVLDEFGYPTYTQTPNFDGSGKIAGGIFQGAATTCNHEIYERILEISKLWASEVYGQPIEYSSWGRAGGISNVFYYLDFATNREYLDSALTQIPWIHTKIRSSIFGHERSVYDILKAYGYKRSGFLNGSGRKPGSGMSNTTFSRVISLNGNVSKKTHNLDGGYTSTFRMYGFNQPGISQAEFEANADNENVMAWRYDADKTAGYSHGVYEGLNRIAKEVAWGIIPMHTEDTIGAGYKRATNALIEEIRLRFCKEAGIEVVSYKEAFDIIQKEIVLSNYFPNFDMFNSINTIVKSATNPQALPDGWVGIGSTGNDIAIGNFIQLSESNKAYIRQYQITYGKLDFTFKAKGTGILRVYRILNKDPYQDGTTALAINPGTPYLQINIDSGDWEDYHGILEIPNVPSESPDPLFKQMDGNHNQVCGLQFTLESTAGDLSAGSFYLGKK